MSDDLLDIMTDAANEEMTGRYVGKAALRDGIRAALNAANQNGYGVVKIKGDPKTFRVIQPELMAH